jgi:hypothetical protein
MSKNCPQLKSMKAKSLVLPSNKLGFLRILVGVIELNTDGHSLKSESKSKKKNQSLIYGERSLQYRL